MAVVTLMRIPGDPEQLLQAKQQHIDPLVAPRAREGGGLAHIVARTSEGLLMINVWESEEARQQASGDPDVADAVASTGMQPGEAETYDVVQLELMG